MAKKSYIELGTELAQRESGTSFLAHAKRLGVTRTAAYRLIKSAEVARQLEQAGLPVPRRESQARILHERLTEPEQRIAAWKAAILTNGVTAAVVHLAVSSVLRPPKINAKPDTDAMLADLDQRITKLLDEDNVPEHKVTETRKLLADWQLTKQKLGQWITWLKENEKKSVMVRTIGNW